MNDTIQFEIEALFRRESGRLISALTRILRERTRRKFAPGLTMFLASE